MKKLNGHIIFITICVIISALFGIAKQEYQFGIFMFVMICVNGYIYYWIYLLIKKNANDPRKQYLQQQNRIYNTVVKATIMPEGTTYKTKGGLASSIIGGSLFGLPGAIVGASLGQRTETHTVRFLVEYMDGHKKIEDVKIDSARYKQLLKFL